MHDIDTRMTGRRARWLVGMALGALALSSQAQAETLQGALAKAYENNPTLTAARAGQRANDENVPIQKASGLPSVGASVDYQENLVIPGNSFVAPGRVLSAGSQLSVPIYQGGAVRNAVKAAEYRVEAGQSDLRATEASIFSQVVGAYMDVIRDQAIVQLNQKNVAVLKTNLQASSDRFEIGDLTRTDVAQSEAQLAAGRTQLLQAESNLTTTRANFRRIIGNEPSQLAPGSPVDRHLPPSLAGSTDLALVENPNITAAMYGIDVSFLQVKVNEGALFPTVTLQGSVQQSYESTMTNYRAFGASAVAQLTVPVYQGGAEYALIRQSKEPLAQQRLNLEQVRDQTRAMVAQAWGQLVASKAQVQSAQAQVQASEIALNGVREEARVGQRTTLDVLNAQQALVNARVALVTAQHDRVVASYSVLSAIGRLSPQVLNLATTVYDPSVHYHQVRDSWFGVRTPDGR